MQQTTKRAYAGLEDYSLAHNAPLEAWTKAGWKAQIVQRRNRPALEFTTASGPRWRFIDGAKPTYDQNPGYKACWYGLARAVKMGGPLFECNGAASTVPAQHRGVAAFSVQGGEGIALRDYLITDLKATLYTGIIYVAYDCDETGRKAAVKRVQEYRKAGFQAEALDLALDIEGGDLADFVALHDNPAQSLMNCKRLLIPATEDKPKRTLPYTGPESDNMAIAAAALAVLHSSRREDQSDWYQVGMAIKDGCAEAGWSLFDNWSQGSDRYNARENRNRWKSFKVGTGIKFATLIALANQDYGSNAWNPSVKPKATGGEHTIPLPAYRWAGGLPDAVRAALNLYAPVGTSAVLNLWVDAIACELLSPDEPVDVPYLKCIFEALGSQMSQGTIRSVANPVSVQFGQKMAHYSISILYLDSGSNTKWARILPNCSPCQNPLLAGRKANLFTLKSPDQIIADISKLAVLPILEKAFPADSSLIAPVHTAFLEDLDCAPEDAERLADELDERYGDILKAQPGFKQAMNQARREFRRLQSSLSSTKSSTVPTTYSTASEFTALFARALIAGEGGQTQYSREVLCARIGTTDKMLPTVFKRAGLVMLKHQMVDVPLANIVAVKALPDQWSAEHKGFPVALVSSRKPEKAFSLHTTREKRVAWAEIELSAGATIAVRYRQANRQVLAERAEPETLPVENRTTVVTQLAIVTTWLRYVRQVIAAWALRVLTAWEHFAQLVSMFVKWVRRDRVRGPRKPKPKTYAEKWLGNLAGAVLPNEATKDGLVNKDGEFLDPIPKNMIGVLVDPPEVIPKTDEPPPIWRDLDDLLVDMVAAGGVIVEVIEYHAEAA